MAHNLPGGVDVRYVEAIPGSDERTKMDFARLLYSSTVKATGASAFSGSSSAALSAAAST
jgi:hypothetical protein